MFIVHAQFTPETPKMRGAGFECLNPSGLKGSSTGSAFSGFGGSSGVEGRWAERYTVIIVAVDNYWLVGTAAIGLAFVVPFAME
jgi:hypothetical protein